MWLLRSTDATLKEFVSPEDVFDCEPPPGWSRGYAILSHVWGENEQTFQEIRALPSKCAPGQTPRDIASEKIRKACELAEERFVEWIWIDTCCINKSSSAELSEAINSMFRYYSLAKECFAYLEDVSSDDGSMPEDEFKNSKWLTRGWTLQELIAPDDLTFISKSWTDIGNKNSHAELLQDATGIPADVLKDSRQMKKYSIAQRMSWAAKRRTTREEDEAYCLLGIFDINMPTLYGEGTKAFRRLQEEIMRQHPDTTLFAWGQHCTWDELVHLRPEDPASCQHVDYHIFATSPSFFYRCSKIRYVDPMKWSKQSSNTEQHDGCITFTSTPHGVSTELPLIKHEGQLLGHLGWVEDGRLLFLLLQPLRSDNILLEDKLHMVGVPLVGAGKFQLPHVVYAPTPLQDSLIMQEPEVVKWKKVYLAYDVVAPTTNDEDTSIFNPVVERPPLDQLYLPFHVDPRHLARLAQDRGVPKFDRIWSNLPDAHAARTGDPTNLVFEMTPWGWMRIHLGVCTQTRLCANPQQVVHWAFVDWHLEDEDEGYIFEQINEHDCSNDHISNWPDFSRKFGLRDVGSNDLQVTLSFTPFQWYPERTLVLRLDFKHVDALPNDCKIVCPQTSFSDGSRSSTRTPLSMSSPLTLAGHASSVIEDFYDGPIQWSEYLGGYPNSDGDPAQSSAPVDEPVASSSVDAPHTESYPQGSRWVEGMQPGETSHKRGYAEMKGTFEGINEYSEVEEETPRWQWKRPKAIVETAPPEDTIAQHSLSVGGETDEREAFVINWKAFGSSEIHPRESDVDER
ncbi:heterokaryon incompatibility protein-domain-containing protein [Fomes fomentarius]|nr:heterokaryon incompatibility protein-domain-containing protein [Fomes fomentarius]